MGLQFFPDKLAALRQVRRVLVPGGRLVLNVGRRATFAREIVAQWEPFAEHDALILSLRVVMAFGRAG
jgi:ubiquinone/menaquinone biosynthesis C-methylase UbiE